jgi:hypothetical protein
MEKEPLTQISIKNLIEDLQELLDRGNTQIGFEGTLVCMDVDGSCNCIRSTENQM